MNNFLTQLSVDDLQAHQYQLQLLTNSQARNTFVSFTMYISINSCGVRSFESALIAGRFQGVIDPLKPTKVTAFTMIFVQFGEHHSRYKATLPSIVLSQQCCEEYFISLAVVNTQWDFSTKEMKSPPPPNLTGWIRTCLIVKTGRSHTFPLKKYFLERYLSAAAKKIVKKTTTNIVAVLSCKSRRTRCWGRQAKSTLCRKGAVPQWINAHTEVKVQKFSHEHSFERT